MYPKCRELEQLAKERREQWDNVIKEIADNAKRRVTPLAPPSSSIAADTHSASDCPTRLPLGLRCWRRARAWLASLRP